MTRYRFFPISIFLTCAALIFGAALYFVRSPYFQLAPEALSLGFSLDMTITFTAAYYFLVVKPYELHPSTMVPVLGLGLLLGHLILPKEHQAGLRDIRWIAGSFELAVTCYLLYNFKNVLFHYRKLREAGSEYTQAVEKSLSQLIPSAVVVHLIATELTILRYGVLGWRQPISEADGKGTFTCYKNSGWSSFLVGLSFLILVEAAGFQFILRQWSPWVSWLHLVLCGYSLIWLSGDYQAIRQNPILLTQEELKIRIGFRWTLRVPLDAISKIESGPEPEEYEEPKYGEFMRKKKDPGYQRMTVFGQPELLISFREPLTAFGLFGVRRSVKKVGISPDDVQAFRKSLEEKLAKAGA